MKTTGSSNLDMSHPVTSSEDRNAWRALLDWHVALGVDEVIGDVPVNAFERKDPDLSSFSALASHGDVPRLQDVVSSTQVSSPASSGPASSGPASSGPASSGLPHGDESPLHVAGPTRPRTQPQPSVTCQPVAGKVDSHQGAAALAAACQSLEDLRCALEQFEGCPLKRTASNTVFADGNPCADLMVIGEAPGRDEDREGVPFVGASGQLLDRMLASIGQTRKTFYITNLLPWRPPGNRAPTDSEVTVCLPFLVRHIELVQPKMLLLVGGLAAKNLFARSEGITRLRGTWRTWASPNTSGPIPSLATFHPAYLLRTPIQKRLAWRDVLEVQLKLRTVGVS